MITEKDIDLIQKFIVKNYPVQRIKHNGKFKRVIISDNGKNFLLSNKNDKLFLKKEMISLVELIFGFNAEETLNIISQHLKI